MASAGYPGTEPAVALRSEGQAGHQRAIEPLPSRHLQASVAVVAQVQSPAQHRPVLIAGQLELAQQ